MSRHRVAPLYKEQDKELSIIVRLRLAPNDGNESNTRLAGEKTYDDRGTVLRQLGVFHEPPSVLGQIGILVTHPVTIARALGRKVWRG